MSHALPFDRFLSTEDAAAGFGGAALIGHMLAFESALAMAQAQAGVIPSDAAAVIAAACDDSFDVDAIVAEGARAGSIAIPLVKSLTAKVTANNAAAGAWVHWGSTSQDVIDTAMALATRASLARIDAGVARSAAALSALARQHRDTPMLARTLLQPAQVVSAGFEMVAWVAPLVRTRRRLRERSAAALQLQLGGAAGTLASMGDKAEVVAHLMAGALGLREPAGAWHTQRDDWAALGCELGVLCGAIGKVALDVGLLAQAELGEMTEAGGAGRGGSSAMPHKRNPVASMIARCAAVRAPHHVAALLSAMPQEHQRALGSWQAELAEWPALMLLTEGAVQALVDLATGLVVEPARMRANIDALQGLVFAEAGAALFARVLGKAGAHALFDQLAKRCVAQRQPLHSLAREARDGDARLKSAVDDAALDAAFSVERAARHAGAIASRQLDALAAEHTASTEPT